MKLICLLRWKLVLYLTLIGFVHLQGEDFRNLKDFGNLVCTKPGISSIDFQHLATILTIPTISINYLSLLKADGGTP
jgi:hypothetical protein